MKVCTSYFYQIRNFPANVVPLSTAKWAPKWYDTTPYIDKRGVLCGYSIPVFAPGASCDGLCSGAEGCQYDSSNCPFLGEYRKQLDKIDYDVLIGALKDLEVELQEEHGINEEITFALMVHEAPTNRCSERAPIQQWFASHGHPITEWHK